MTARGGTNIHDALLEALRQPPAEGTLPIVLFMTDGLPTVGQTSEAAIRELARKGNPHQRRIFTFGVGVDVNTPLLEKIAYESRATTTFILPGEDVEVKVAAVFKRLRGPVLADPDLAIGGERRTPPHPGADPAPDSRRLRGRPDRRARPVHRRGAAGVHAPGELPGDAARVHSSASRSTRRPRATASSPGSGPAARSASWSTRSASKEVRRASSPARPRRPPTRRPASSSTRSSGSRPSSASSPSTPRSWHARGPTSRRKTRSSPRPRTSSATARSRPGAGSRRSIKT